MNLRKSILALSVVAGIVAAPMTVFAAHTFVEKYAWYI